MEQIEKLNITFAGVRMRSPLGISTINMPLGERLAIDPEVHAQVLLKHAEAGAGFICVPGFSFITKEMISRLQQQARPREFSSVPPATRFMKIEGIDGLYFFHSPMAVPPERSIETFDLVRRTIDIVRKRRPEGVAIIVMVGTLGDFPETTVSSAKKAEELGADLLELNFGCGLAPGIDGAVEYYLEKKYPLLTAGTLLGDRLDLVEKIVTEVVRSVDVPVGVKLTPEVGFPRVVEFARHLRNAGAKYIEIFNLAPAIAPPDIYNRGKSRWPYVDGNPFVAETGGSLRMRCYKNVAGVAKFAPGIDIAASGGLLTPEHAVEVMMLGAKLAEFCTGMLSRGRSLLREATEFLKRFLPEQGYNSVEELVGLGVQYIKPQDKISVGRMVAEVDPTRCKQSGLCTDHICIAMDRENGKAKVREEACSGCGLCVITCPNQAIKLIPRT